MQRVYLNGGIAQFGEYWEANCKNIRDIFKLIECQTPGFRKYLIDAAESGVGFEIQRGSEILEISDELLLSLNNEDIIITEVPAGSKSGGAKILAALAIIAVVVLTGGTAAPGLAGGAGTGAGTAGAGAAGAGAAGAGAAGAGASSASWLASLNGYQLFGLSVATNLALTGISQLMMPGPEVDGGTDESYLFDGPTNSITQGLPVPVAYGELIVGGAPVSQYYKAAGKQQDGVFTGSGFIGDSFTAAGTTFVPGVTIVDYYGPDGKTDGDEYGERDS